MTIKRKLESISLLSAICWLLLLAGCQTGGFSKPDLSSLAFWKRDRQTVSVPPPPARHFDPATIQSKPNEQLAEKKARPSGRPGGLSELTAEAPINAKNKPIREPYSIAKNESDPPASDNRFNLNADRIESFEKSNGFGGNSQLNSAQVDFQSAMEQPVNAVTDLVHETERGLGRTLDESQDRIAETSSQIADHSADAIKQKSQGLKESFDNGFDRFSARVDDVRNSVQNKLSNVSDATRDALQRPFPNLNPLSKETRLVDPSEDPTLGQMQTELETTRRNMEMLRQQLAESKQLALENEPDFAPQARPEPNFDRELSPNPVVAPSSTASTGSTGTSASGVNQFSGNRGAGNSGAPLQPVPLATPTDYASTNGFPATPYGGFAGTTATVPPAEKQPGTTATAGGAFQGTAMAPRPGTSNAPVVGTTPVAPGSENRVAELDIPDAILVGKGSYAPGSVNRLRQQ